MTRTSSPHRSVVLPSGPLTVAEYVALGDADHLRSLELQEGSIVVSPSASLRHMRASGRLFDAVSTQVRSFGEVLYETDVDLRLVPDDQAGTVRQPDLIVVDLDAVDRVTRAGRILQASDVLLAVEIVSPGSGRLDRMIKRDEYADAGIPVYWIVEIDPRPNLTEHRLRPDGRYDVRPAVTGTFAGDAPFPISIDLDALV